MAAYTSVMWSWGAIWLPIAIPVSVATIAVVPISRMVAWNVIHQAFLQWSRAAALQRQCQVCPRVGLVQFAAGIIGRAVMSGKILGISKQFIDLAIPIDARGRSVRPARGLAFELACMEFTNSLHGIT